MIKIFNTLVCIYKNRWREINYEDFSKGSILLILYIVGIFILYKRNDNYSLYIYLLLLVSQIVREHIYRKDNSVLKMLFIQKKRYLILCCDYLILSSPILLLIGMINCLWLIFCLIFISIISLVNVSYNRTLKIPFLLSGDPLWKTFIRKYPFVIIVFIFTYYLHYKGMKVENPNLSKGAVLSSSLVVMMINGQKEKVNFIKFSRLSAKEYLLRILLANIVNTIFFLIPHGMINLLFFQFNFLAYSMVYIYIIFLVLIRYVFFHQEIVYSIFSILSLLAVFSLGIAKDASWYIYAGILLFIVFLFTRAKDKIKNLQEV